MHTPPSLFDYWTFNDAARFNLFDLLLTGCLDPEGETVQSKSAQLIFTTYFFHMHTVLQFNH